MPAPQAGGIYSLLPVDRIPASLPELSNPDVAGISVRFYWKTLEPQPGKYHWEPLDRAIALASESGKKIMIRVIAGLGTPEWVYQAGAQRATPRFRPKQLERLPAQRRRRLTRIRQVPVVWDPHYLTPWLAFIKAFGRRYDGHPALYSIQMSGGGIGGEMSLRREFDWGRYGYTDARLIATWKQIIDAYQQSFPSTRTNLDILEPIPRRSQVLQPVVDYCLSKYPGRVFLQYNGLNATGGPPQYRTIIRQAAGKTKVGYQMTGGGKWLESKVGDRGKAFRHALEDGASYLEVYHGDLINPALAPAIHSLALGLAQN
ncbi:MAG: beta-galactosidase [Syntrophales bacterium]|nr:beta-galactosidase [Syntrophales bacterium]